MSAVSITLTDDGLAVACQVVYADGYNPNSGAHITAQAMIAWMDQHMSTLGPADTVNLTVRQDLPPRLILDA